MGGALESLNHTASSPTALVRESAPVCVVSARSRYVQEVSLKYGASQAPKTARKRDTPRIQLVARFELVMHGVCTESGLRVDRSLQFGWQRMPCQTSPDRA